MKWGYTCSSEEFEASELVEQAAMAEQSGFDFVTVSDHFHPWTSSQGHSPFAWTTIGGIAALGFGLPPQPGAPYADPCINFDRAGGEPPDMLTRDYVAADIQLDDATVSRRHALIIRTSDDELRALDDRSLNGLFVNGERVEWAPLVDGDELEIGRYRLYVLQS